MASMDCNIGLELTMPYVSSNGLSDAARRGIRVTEGQRTELSLHHNQPQDLMGTTQTRVGMSPELGPRVYDPVGGTWTRKPIRRPPATFKFGKRVEKSKTTSTGSQRSQESSSQSTPKKRERAASQNGNEGKRPRTQSADTNHGGRHNHDAFVDLTDDVDVSPSRKRPAWQHADAASPSAHSSPTGSRYISDQSPGNNIKSAGGTSRNVPSTGVSSKVHRSSYPSTLYTHGFPATAVDRKTRAPSGTRTVNDSLESGTASKSTTKQFGPFVEDASSGSDDDIPPLSRMTASSKESSFDAGNVSLAKTHRAKRQTQEDLLEGGTSTDGDSPAVPPRVPQKAPSPLFEPRSPADDISTSTNRSHNARTRLIDIAAAHTLPDETRNQEEYPQRPEHSPFGASLLEDLPKRPISTLEVKKEVPTDQQAHISSSRHETFASSSTTSSRVRSGSGTWTEPQEHGCNRLLAHPEDLQNAHHLGLPRPQQPTMPSKTLVDIASPGYVGPSQGILPSSFWSAKAPDDDQSVAAGQLFPETFASRPRSLSLISQMQATQHLNTADDFPDSATVRIPESLRRDRQGVSEESLDKHSHAGASRNIAGHANRLGFSFDEAEEDDEKDVFDENRQSSTMTPPDPSAIAEDTHGPISLSRLAQISNKGPKDNNTKPEKQITSSVAKEAVYDWDAFIKTKGSTMTIGEYVLQAAASNRHAVNIADSLRKLLQRKGKRHLWSCKAIRDYVKDVTGKDMPQYRESSKKSKGSQEEKSSKDLMLGFLSDDHQRRVTQRNNISPAVTIGAQQDAVESCRPQHGFKVPVAGWKARILSEQGSRHLHNNPDDTDDEEDVLVEDEMSEGESVEEDDGLSRPFIVYTVWKAKTKIVQEDEEDDGDGDHTDQTTFRVGDYLDLREANSAAYQTIMSSTSLVGSFSWTTEEDHRMTYEHSSVLYTIKSWIEKRVEREPYLPRPRRAAQRFPLRVYEVWEKVRTAPRDEARTSSPAGPKSSQGTSLAASVGSEPDSKEATEEDKKQRSSLATDQAMEQGSTGTTTVLIDRPAAAALYTSVQQANAVAARYVIDQVFKLQMPRYNNLDQRDLWVQQQTEKVRRLQKTCDELQEGLSEVRPVKVKREDGVWEDRLWTVEVVCRGIEGPLN
ncbi:hypothetical protein ANO11243_087420 [Dothideomycetidae sp. 11243]|nr:hypothetical protein ANO11243_087420 [fungal sp. No.11243]